MSIRAKIILIVLPLIITPLLLTAIVSSLSARNGITLVATDFLRFKSEDLKNYADSQWSLLVENNLTDNREFISASKSAVQSFARSLIRRESELILALDEQGKVVMQSDEVEITPSEELRLRQMVSKKEEGWQRINLGGIPRVAQSTTFEPFGWFLLVTEHQARFYQTVNQMFWQTGFILGISLLVSVALLLTFSYYITQPLRNVIGAMREVISTNDLSKRVEIIYRDETGELGHTFNIMTDELDRAYRQIKGYALKAAIAQSREQKIRNIFQKYVPNDVIEQFFANPEAMLVGEDRSLAVLFSDIRSFTRISEKMTPREIVESLNAYFERMVEIIMNRHGIVDKYIGDAIMAFYGAPVKHEDDAFQAVLSAFEMLRTLREFNRGQQSRNRPTFRIGIGINFGSVTVGNIGSEKKMDYTVVGDMVNLASRLEGLTKVYHEPFIISEYVYEMVKEKVPCRLIDRVVVRGRTKGVGIYTPRSEFTRTVKTAWKYHIAGLKLFYNRDFDRAARYFEKVHELMPNDMCSQIFLDRCQAYKNLSLPSDWDGAVEMVEK
jgi:adenylate cyclase